MKVSIGFFQILEIKRDDARFKDLLKRLNLPE